jgi:hypothetical protein
MVFSPIIGGVLMYISEVKEFTPSNMKSLFTGTSTFKHPVKLNCADSNLFFP